MSSTRAVPRGLVAVSEPIHKASASYLMSAITVLMMAVLLRCAPRVIIPRNPAAMACWRECVALYQQCLSTGAMTAKLHDAPDFSGFVCRANQRECLLTCPGAHPEEPPPAAE